MKRWPLGFLLVLAVSAHAGSFWDGNAAVQRGDAAFEAGRFAVSSAFARDTEIVIEDLATGKTTTARVTGRIEGRLDILVLLSPAAALPLGLEPGDIAHVRVTIKRVAAESAPILAEETAKTADPDRVPPAVQREATVVEPAEPAPVAAAAEPAPVAAAAAAAEPAPVAEAVKTGTAAETTPQVETAKTPEPAVAAVETPAEEPVVAAPAEEPVVAAAVEAPAEEPSEEPVTSAEDAALLAELAARSPQKQLFLPPREDEMFAYQEPVEPPAEAAAPAVEVVEQPPESAPAAVEVAASEAPEIASDAGPAEPGFGPEPIALAEAKPPEEIRPELVESLAAKAPVPEADTVRSFAEPAAVVAGTAAAQPPAVAVAAPPAEKPSEPAPATQAAQPPGTVVAAAPVAKPVETAPPTTTAKPAPVQTVLDLPAKGAFTWYVQLAAYANETLAKDTAARLSSTYPVLVLAPQPGAKALYRIFVGPLNKAESGTLLAYFRYRGFPDAFVRTAQK